MRHGRTIALVASVGLAAAGTGGAVAATQKRAPKRVNVIALDRTVVKINRYVQSGMRWNQDVYRIRSGGTVHLVNRSRQEPHTFSIVPKKDLPKTTKQILNCGQGSKPDACAKIGQEHEFNPQTNQVGKPVVDTGKPGADKAYDSWVLNPGGKLSVKVSAKAGSVLHFFCAVHPWMQAKIVVSK